MVATHTKFCILRTQHTGVSDIALEGRALQVDVLVQASSHRAELLLAPCHFLLGILLLSCTIPTYHFLALVYNRTIPLHILHRNHVFLHPLRS